MQMRFQSVSHSVLGLQGYIKIARAHHGCGITTDPVYAVFKSARFADA